MYVPKTGGKCETHLNTPTVQVGMTYGIDYDTISFYNFAYSVHNNLHASKQVNSICKIEVPTKKHFL